jgi:hypothetical protein
VPDADRPAAPVPGYQSSLLATASVVATIAFWAYSRTLLPGVDLGDTGGFQAAAIWTETSGRESYPLYFTLGQWFIQATSTINPARGLNLFSALWGAAAAGLVTFVAGRVTRSAPAGAVAGLLLAFSYTFWTQAIIAEVYTLHLTLMASCLLALMLFQDRPTTGRLVLFFAVYAAAFGNHYTMILLLVPFALFLLLVDPRPRELFRLPIVALALGAAAIGAMQYAGNFLSVWTSIDAPPSVSQRLASFWFDATKADWRDAMVLGVTGSGISDRLAMWWWDARQQFGAAGLLIGAVGVVRLWRIAPPWAATVMLAYAIAAVFALTYNVGDVHVFFLPAHFFTAFAAAAAVAPSGRSKVPLAAALLALAYAGWRGWDTWPAVDRHDDRRAEQLIARMAEGVTDHEAILLSQMDWQSENALLYTARHDRRDLAWTRLADVLPALPFLVADNHRIGRDVVLTSDAATEIVAAYGPFFPIVPDDRVPVLSIPEVVSRLPAGTPYVLTLLPPAGNDRLDEVELDATLAALTGARPRTRSRSRYEVWAGTAGQPAEFHRVSERPFRAVFNLGGDPFTVRMESWLPGDTFRRAGFGRVLRERQPVLTIERGVSLIWFRPDGSPAVLYAAGLYAVRPRFRIPAQTEQFALCSNPCGSPISY